MEKIVVFPLNGDTEVLVKNLQDSDKYNIVAVSSYYEDAERLEQLEKESGIYCSTDFESCIQKADTVIFADNTMGHNYEGYNVRLNKAIVCDKKIYIDVILLGRLSIESAIKNFHILQDEVELTDIEGKQKKEIDVPVVSIMGFGENCDKFKLQVKVKKMIERQGYKVLSIFSNAMGKFLGSEILPGFLFSKEISFPVKIKAFNLWIYQLQEYYKADIILIGCPGGIVEFKEYENNFYGEIPLIISSGILVDAGIITLYANSEQDNESTELLKDYCLRKYNTEVNDFVMSKQFYKADNEWRRIRYYTITEEGDALQYSNEDSLGCCTSFIEDNLGIKEQVKRILRKFEKNISTI